MKKATHRTMLVGVAAMLAAHCKADRDGQILADGSSTVFPITAAAAEGFSKAREPKVGVWVSGTGGGFRRFCSGQTDISNASRPIESAEAEACRANGIDFVELPIAYDGLAVVVHSTNTWARALTTEELARIWRPAAEGTLTRWSQVREGWPDRELHLYGPGNDSGTYDYFTRAIVGQERSSRHDYKASEDDLELVELMAADELGLGYFGFGYYGENRARLNLVAIDDGRADNGSGPVAPSDATVADGTYQPLSRPLFVYFTEASLARPAVSGFAEHYLKNAAEFAARAGYTPLTPELYALAQTRLANRKTGSAFDGAGSQVGVSIVELLRRESN